MPETVERSATLNLARAWYGVLGAGALILTSGEILDDFNPGSVVDVPNLAAGIAVGVLMLAAAAWVVSPGRVRAAVAWVGIVAGVAPFAVLLWITVNTASADAIALAAVPTVLAMLAGIRMTVARLRT
jgi:hypothetical protein